MSSYEDDKEDTDQELAYCHEHNKELCFHDITTDTVSIEHATPALISCNISGCNCKDTDIEYKMVTPRKAPKLESYQALLGAAEDLLARIEFTQAPTSNAAKALCEDASKVLERIGYARNQIGMLAQEKRSSADVEMITQTEADAYYDAMYTAGHN